LTVYADSSFIVSLYVTDSHSVDSRQRIRTVSRLWWKQKTVAVRRDAGWRRAMFDLHHSLGVLGFLIMFLLAVTGIGMTATTEGGKANRVITRLHTTRGYPLPIKLLYTIGTTAFVIQGVTGLVMWRKPGAHTNIKKP